MDGEIGLRDRKKARTRNALSAAALILALERGLDDVTADEIAAAADVSPRTFHNYFASKDEALAAGWRSLLEDYVARLAARPADEPILASLEIVFGNIAADAVASQQATELHLDLFTSPAFAAQRGLLIDEAVGAFAAVVAARTGTSPDDIYPRLVTMAAVSAVLTAYQFEPDEALDENQRARRLSECFALLRSGLSRSPMDER